MPRKPAKVSPPSPSSQLAHLREFTAKYGLLHDAQVLQLKLWPLVAFPHSTSSKAEVSVEERSVRFQITTKGKGPKNLSVRLHSLGESVQWLLGADWTVAVYENKKRVFWLGRKIDRPDPVKYAGTDFEAGRIVPEQPWKFKKGD